MQCNWDVNVAYTAAQSKLLQLLWVTSAVNVREPVLHYVLKDWVNISK